jgi:hypothetical protein
MSYLPQCDLGLLLISAVNPINEEDLNTICALSQAGIPVMGLLSKADLLSPADREKALAYTKKEVLANLGLQIDVHPVSTVGRDEALLEDWFRDHMAPLFGRHRELAHESIRRKAGALREAVIAALRSKLGVAETAAQAIPIPLEEIERKLRTAAGEIEETRQFCFVAIDDVRALNEIALHSSVQVIMESWDGQGTALPSGTGLIRHTTERLAAEAASQISGRLITLTQHLQSALALANDALSDKSSKQDDQLEDSVREMPRFESALPEMDIAPPWFHSVRGMTRAWLFRKLRRTTSSGLQTGFTNYRRALETWVRRVLAELQMRFDSRADGHRAQLARLMNRKSLPVEEKTRMKRHLAELEGLLAGDTSELSATTIQSSTQPFE